eukprot:351895-Chlamydomonas_euryale.AAC.2
MCGMRRGVHGRPHEEKLAWHSPEPPLLPSELQQGAALTCTNESTVAAHGSAAIPASVSEAEGK